MSSYNDVKNEVFDAIKALIEENSQIIIDDMPLIGSASLLDSMKLVELCLTLEDKATGLGFECDWTSEAAMSNSSSMFKTAGSLTNEFINQLEAKK
jgi:acyl carrier protein